MSTPGNPTLRHPSLPPTRPALTADATAARRTDAGAQSRSTEEEPELTYERALTEVVSQAGIAYGYTLTVWAVGALAVARFGLPTAAQVLLFVAGGSAAYVALALRVSHRRVVHAAYPPAALWENVCAVPAIGIAWVVYAVVPEVWLAYLVAPLIATLGYLLGLALFVRLVGIREQRAGAVLPERLPGT